ncbi:MAG: mannose-6-phosphate isomerase, class I [Desulfobacteraceae bacterium]|jgi:mannose-6-phosphate isomerase
MKEISILRNPVQNYAWGSMTFIPELLGRSVPSEKPQAELWMGVHPKAPSQVLCDGEWISLPEFIRTDPEGVLGESVAKNFSNELPFLFKVLAATRPLSIQAHPSRDQAKAGFARENDMKIPLDAPNRNYRDENHKPEMICALTPFWLLNGFRKIHDLIALTERIGAPALRDIVRPLHGSHEAEGFKVFLTSLFTMDRDTQTQLVSEVIRYIAQISGTNAALEWVVRLNQAYPGDMGILSPLFMNIVRLKPGQGVYMPSGRLHSYLEGAGIELMANSDNVLRGGLTAKNMDIRELLKILDFTHNQVDILRPKSLDKAEVIYDTPAKEFVLSMISVERGSSFESSATRSVEIMICSEGDAQISDLGNGNILSLTRGTSLIVPAAVEHYRIEGKATLFKAAVSL